MPAAIPFDTLDYARKLEATGVPSAQAELHARALNDAIASSAASRDDLARLESRLDAKFANIDAKFANLDIKIANVVSRFDAKIANLESRFDAKIANLELRFDAKIANLESSIDAKLANLETRLNAKIDALDLKLGGKIETLRWMFATLVVLNGAMLVQLFFKH